MINGCSDKNSARFEDDLRIYAAFARRNGAPADVVQGAVRMQRESIFHVLPEREVALLAEAGSVMCACSTPACGFSVGSPAPNVLACRHRAALKSSQFIRTRP